MGFLEERRPAPASDEKDEFKVWICNSASGVPLAGAVVVRAPRLSSQKPIKWIFWRTISFTVVLPFLRFEIDKGRSTILVELSQYRDAVITSLLLGLPGLRYALLCNTYKDNAYLSI